MRQVFARCVTSDRVRQLTGDEQSETKFSRSRFYLSIAPEQFRCCLLMSSVCGFGALLAKLEVASNKSKLVLWLWTAGFSDNWVLCGFWDTLLLQKCFE